MHSQNKQYKEQGINKIQYKLEQDFFLRYLSKKVRNLNKKLQNVLQLEKRYENLNQQQRHKIQKKKSVEDQIAMFAKMKQHYLIAHSQKDTKQVISLESISRLISEIVIYGSLSFEDTVVKQNLRLNCPTKDLFEEFGKAKQYFLNPLAGINSDLNLNTIIGQRTQQIYSALCNVELRSYLRNINSLKFNQRSVELLKHEIVLEEKEQQQQNDEQNIPPKVLHEKKNSSSEESAFKKLGLQNYEGDEEVFTGQSDGKVGSPDDVKKKKILNKKKGNKAYKKYVEQQNYYASHEEQKHKIYKGYNWRIRGQQQFDTDKQKVYDEIIDKKK